MITQKRKNKILGILQDCQSVKIPFSEAILVVADSLKIGPYTALDLIREVNDQNRK